MKLVHPPLHLSVVISQTPLGISEETVFLRRESPYLLKHITPSSSGSQQFRSGIIAPHSSPTRGHWPQQPFLIFQQYLQKSSVYRD